MKGALAYDIEELKGVERDGNPLPRDRDPRSAYTALNLRIGHEQGMATKLGGRASIYTTAYAAGATLPGHILGLTEARIGATDYLIACPSTNDLTTQTIGQLTYSAGAWTFDDIKRAAYGPDCPIARRFNFAVLRDQLIISDYGLNNLEQWAGGIGGAVKTTALTTTGITNLKARYLQVVGDFLFLGHTSENAVVYPDRIRWSNAGNPETYSSNDFATLSTKDGDICMGLSAIQNMAVGFKRNSIWVGAFIDSSIGYQFEKIVVDKGTISPFAIVSVGNYIAFVSHDGVYVFDGSPLPRKISGKKISRLFLSLIGLEEESAYQVIGYVHPFKPELWFSSYQTTDYPTWIYNYETDDWSYSNMKFQALTVARRTQRATWDSLATEVNRYTWDSIVYMDGDRTWDKAFYQTLKKILVGGTSAPDSTQATVYEVDIGAYYDKNTSTTALTSTYRTANIDCGRPNQRKRFLGATLRLQPRKATLTIRSYLDGSLVGAPITLTVASTGADYVEKTIYFNQVGVNLQIEIENATAAESMALMGYTIHYVPREDLK